MMSRLTIDHAFITRFNVPTPGREGFIRAQDGWLKDRVQLFERFCLPSVEAQTLQSFHWLVYFDPDSPQWFVDWLEDSKSSKRFTAIFRTSVSRDELISDLKQVTGGRGDLLLTTNLDNDDGLAVDFVRRLQDAVTSSNRTALYLTRGLILRDRSIYLRSDPFNAFCSVAESWISPVTAWADWHNRLGLAMTVQSVSGLPAWLQVVHGRNVSNTVHGRLCNPSVFNDLFPYALNEMPSPSKERLLLDKLVHGPIRSLEAGLRSGMKGLVLTFLGKSRFDAVKNTAATASSRVRHLISLVRNPGWSRVAKETEE